MNTEILGVVAQIALMVILAYPLGKYIARVYNFECFLVFLGNGIVGFAGMVAFESRR